MSPFVFIIDSLFCKSNPYACDDGSSADKMTLIFDPSRPFEHDLDYMIRRWISLESAQFWKIWWGFLLTALLSIAFSLLFIDQAWARFFGSKELERVWLFHRNITEIGAAEIYIVLALGALLFRLSRKWGAYTLTCLLSSGVVLHLLKFIFGRVRPHKAPLQDPFLFEPFNFHHHFQSFPSGHSQTLFAVATVVSYFFPRLTPWVFTCALYFAFTRAFTLAHFVSDVWAGAALGLLVSALTLRKLTQKYGS